MSNKRPLTQRELRNRKAKKSQVAKITIVNKSGKQTIPIQLRAPAGMSFWVGEMTVPLYPKRMAVFPEDRLYWDQIKNFEKAGRIQIIGTPQS
jgi:hypothetical protein